MSRKDDSWRAVRFLLGSPHTGQLEPERLQDRPGGWATSGGVAGGWHPACPLSQTIWKDRPRLCISRGLPSACESSGQSRIQRRSVVMKSITIIAFDQHAATTVAAVLLPGQRTPALHALTSDSPTILRFVKRLQRDGTRVRCCYEAGPCGFELQRALTAAGIPCDVIAPALIPRRAGDRIKTDRRDAAQLA